MESVHVFPHKLYSDLNLQYWYKFYTFSVMRLPMRMTNVLVEDLGRESARFMLEACDAFFVDLNSGDG